MNAELSPAVESLRNQLREQEAEATETKKMINALLRRMKEEPEFPEVESGQMQIRMSGAVRPDQYYGKPFATAAQEYLDRRKQACTADEIMNALENGGFDFRTLSWKDRKDWPRLTAISLAKNTQKFHKLPNGTFGLLSWYPDVAKRSEDAIRPAKKKKGASKKAGKAKDSTLCARGCGKPPHKGGCRPLDAKGSAKEKIHLAADQTGQKEEETA